MKNFQKENGSNNHHSNKVFMGPNGLIHPPKQEFKLGKGIKVFCHACNKGFKSLDEGQIHNKSKEHLRNI